MRQVIQYFKCVREKWITLPCLPSPCCLRTYCRFCHSSSRIMQFSASTCHEILFSASLCFFLFFYSASCKFITPLSAFALHLVLTELCTLSPTLKCLTTILLIAQSCIYADGLTDLISRVNFSSVFLTPYHSFVIVYFLVDLTNIV
jgi:hypothetical protein